MNSRLLLVAAFVSGTAYGWGPEGHQTIARIASDLIAGSNAETQVRTLLGSVTLVDAAVWADCAKGVNPTTLQYQGAGRFPECAVFETPEGEAAMVDFVRRNATNCVIKPAEEICHKQYHYSDVAIQHMTYQASFVGARNDDIVAAVIAVTHVLKGDPAPAPFSIKDKPEALRLLAHYAGDIHQPLHVGAIYLDAQGNEIDPDAGTFDPATATRGANNIMVLPGTKRNLHATWDAIPASLKMSRVNAAWLSAARAVPASSGSDLAWPQQWASDSVAEASQAFSGLAFGPLASGHWTVTLPSGYSRTMSAIKKRQLTRGGARLAKLLQDIFP
ncbi:MAG TPA: S1/P1 nuclease [Terriglobales bacterium]|nr:S1/P1 nuclease [Terriglobales bacterium]HXZ58752.1 S1/P1 nuclease [Steroidobacteraceae bacterium]